MATDTSIGAAMAANVVKGENKPKADNKKADTFAALGSHAFMGGDGKQYPRQTGWGANKVKHPEGGTNETAAFIIFRPFTGTNLELQGRVYLERFNEGGKAKRRYSISLPFLKADKKDTAGRIAIEGLKLKLKDAYREWLKTADKTVSAPVAADNGSWEESDE